MVTLPSVVREEPTEHELFLDFNMTSFKRFEYTPKVKYEYIARAVPIVLPLRMLIYE